jgi:hypothetical protein
VEDWLSETIMELEAASDSLKAAAVGVSGSLTEAQMRLVWAAYVKVEKAVAFVKLEALSETPGRFVDPKPYAVPDERQALGFALRWVADALASLSEGSFSRALKELRESRNYLRVLLKRSGWGRPPRRAGAA